MTGKTFEDGDMERRVQFLEKGFDKIDGKLDRLLDTLVAFRRETDLRFADLEKQMDSRFADLEKRMEARFGDVNARFADFEKRMEARFADVDARFGALEIKVEARFGALETRIEARFGTIEGQLERINEKLEHKASTADVAEVRGMVRSLPTIMHMITLVFGILAGAFAIIKYGLPHP